MLHLDLPTRADVESLIHSRGPARVSIYLPTTPVTQQAQADRIALKNLADQALNQFGDGEKKERKAIEELLHDLVDDDGFWDTQAHSLAVFATPEGLRTFRLPNRLQPIVEVSDRFHIKPLLRAITVPQSAFVLALSQNGVRLVQVSADTAAAPVKVDGLPRDAATAAGKASLNDRSPSGRIQGSEGKNVRLIQYARKVDHALRPLLTGRDTPLILAATEPLRSIYASVNSYPHLAQAAISTNPDEMSDGELATQARTVLDGLFQEELAAIVALFEARSGQGRTTTDVATAARAATQGAISKLLVDIDEVVPGMVDDDGVVTFAKTADAVNYGVVDEIAARALLTGARVLAVRKGDIPGGGSLAAVMRYAF